MENEAIVHTVALLLTALAALLLGTAVDIDVSDLWIDVALAVMLYFVFICIDGRSMVDAFRNVRFTGTSVLVNFLWTPFFAFGLGYLFFTGEPDIRIGLLLALAAPCTDWYLVFTASAKGNVPLSSTILPLNLLLQVILTPIYLLLFFGSEIHIDSLMPIMLAVMTLAVPFAIAFLLKHLAHVGKGAGRIVASSQDNASLGQIVSLCAAVFVMFLVCADDISDNWQTLLECVVPFVLFFIVNTVLCLGISRKACFAKADSTSLLFTALARNSPLILAIMSPIFQDNSLVLAVLVVCPLIELPFLSVMSTLRLRMVEKEGSLYI